MDILFRFSLIAMFFGCLQGQYLPEHAKICPPKNLISPCLCTKSCDACVAKIECTNILNSDELGEVFNKSTDWTFWDFHIVHSSFQYIPSNAIVEKKVRKLYLRDDVMIALFDEPPPVTNFLQELEFTNLRLQRGINWEVFTPLVHLKELNFTNFEIKSMDQSFIDNFPQQLTGLYFAETKTKHLGDTTFSKLEQLTRIFVRKTKIKTLKRSMFPAISKLIAINFSGSLISSLPDDLFSNMPDLQGIEFSNTLVVTLSVSVFGGIMPQLSLLYFDGNAINCNCQLKWIPAQDHLPRYIKVRCTTPQALEGISIKDLKQRDFAHCE